MYFGPVLYGTIPAVTADVSKVVARIKNRILDDENVAHLLRLASPRHLSSILVLLPSLYLLLSAPISFRTG